MHSRSTLMMLLLAPLLTASNFAAAADRKSGADEARGMPGMEKMDMDHGMMHGGMMQGGMMDMMKGCRRMMSDPMLPQLPAGNEKLQLQMQAEMMQKMGEILGKYTDKLKDEKGSTP